MRACGWRGVRKWLLLSVLMVVSCGGVVVAAPLGAVADAGSGVAVEATPAVTLSGDGVVRGLLFYSPTCPHCHIVTTEVLPPLRAEYGDDLIIAELDTTSPEGRAIWQATVTLYDPPVVGVPTLLIGEYILIGSREIPERLPGIIRDYQDAGGVGWPSLPGLEEVVAQLEVNRPAGLLDDVRARFERDLAGNSLSVIVLAALVAGLVAVIKPRPWQSVWWERARHWVLVPLIVGLGVSIYLAHVETSGSPAVCGPVGDCNAVQQSSYAMLFGVLPVAVLGVIGYVGILLTYGLWWLTKIPFRQYLPGAVFAMAFFGLGFATYLTFLEPFVIGATCAWCLTQSVCMLVVALLTAGPGWASLRELARETGLVEAVAR